VHAGEMNGKSCKVHIFRFPPGADIRTHSPVSRAIKVEQDKP